MFFNWTSLRPSIIRRTRSGEGPEKRAETEWGKTTGQGAGTNGDGKRYHEAKPGNTILFVNVINYLFLSGDIEGWRETEARARGLGSGDCSPVTDLEFVKQFTPAKLLIALDSTDKFHYNPITHVDTDSSGENKHVSGFSHTCVENDQHLQI